MKNSFLILGILFTAFAIIGCQNNTMYKGDPTSIVEIVIPSDIETYKSNMAEYSQIGGENNPAETTEFITQEIKSSSHDSIQASAIIAAKVIKDDVAISYFEIKNKTAYLRLNFQDDGYAGVSVHIAQIKPVVTRTLLNWPEIDNVVFDYAK